MTYNLNPADRGMITVTKQISHCYFTPNKIAFQFSILKIFLYFFNTIMGPGGSMSQVVELPNNSYKPITNTKWVRARLCKLQIKVHSTCSGKCKVYQLLAHGQWFSPGTPASSTSGTTKTGRHDIAYCIKHQKSNQIKYYQAK